MANEFDFDGEDDPDVDYNPRVSSDEFDTGEEEAAADGAEQVVAAMTAGEDAGSDLMNDAVRRIDLANCYRDLLSVPLFDDPDDNSGQVEQEVRSFVHERIQVLLGIKADSRPMAPVVKLPFSEDEINTLKVLAAFGPNDVRIMKAVITTAARSRSIMGDAKKDGSPATPGAAPSVRTRPSRPAPAAVPPAPAKPTPPRPTPVPAAPTLAPRAPAPQAPRPAPAGPRPTARRAGAVSARPQPQPLTRRTPGAPPAKIEEKRVIAHPTTGEGIAVTARRIQRPVGMVPMPTDPRQFEALSLMAAAGQSAAFERSPDVQDRGNNS